MQRIVLLALVALGVGCHAKFKKNASSLGEVRPQILLTTGPTVQLGHLHDDSIVAAVVNVVQEVKGVKVARRLADAVDIEAVNTAFGDSLVDVLKGGPPFGTTDREDASVLQVEIVRYGLFVPALGAPGEFDYQIRVRIYRPDGERVYSTSQTCATGAGDPGVVSEALWVVDNVKELEEMSDAQITDAFAATAAFCGSELVRRMRKHAS